MANKKKKKNNTKKVLNVNTISNNPEFNLLING